MRETRKGNGAGQKKEKKNTPLGGGDEREKGQGGGGMRKGRRKGSSLTRYMYAQYMEKENQKRYLVISSLSKRAHALCACDIKMEGNFTSSYISKSAIPKRAKKDKKASEGG